MERSDRPTVYRIEKSEMGEHNHELEGLTIRRAYIALVFGAPWGLIVVGVGLILFGLLAHRPTAVLVTAIGFGAVMAVIGCLALRISGPIELSHKGFKGNLDTVPTGALVLARSAAEKALPANEPDRTEKIETAARQAVLELLRAVQANQPVLFGTTKAWLSPVSFPLARYGGTFFTVPGGGSVFTEPSLRTGILPSWETSSTGPEAGDPQESSADEPFGDDDRDARER